MRYTVSSSHEPGYRFEANTQKEMEGVIRDHLCQQWWPQIQEKLQPLAKQWVVDFENLQISFQRNDVERGFQLHAELKIGFLAGALFDTGCEAALKTCYHANMKNNEDGASTSKTHTTEKKRRRITDDITVG